MEPLIITIGRTHGSSGREIGQNLAQRLGIPFYDKESLMERAKGSKDYQEVRSFYEKRPVNSLLYAIAMNQEERNMGEIPFRRIKSFVGEQGGVLVGRCGNYMFRSNQNAVSLFIHASEEIRSKKIAQAEHISLSAAKEKIKEVDEERYEFHRYFTGETWGKAEGYELCLDSGILGIDGCVEMILAYLKRRGFCET